MTLPRQLILDYLRKYGDGTIKQLRLFVESETYHDQPDSVIRNAIDDLINKGHPIEFIGQRYVYGGIAA